MNTAREKSTTETTRRRSRFGLFPSPLRAPLWTPLRALLWAGLLGFTSPGVLAQPGAQSPAQPLADFAVPADMSGVHFYLITIDVGDNVWDNFGHTALRVLDDNNNTDTVFNWGVFEVNGGPVRFSYDFFRGIVEYRLATHPPTREFAAYRDQQRSVWQDTINLTNPQKEILYRRLMWNLQPQNVYYDYHHFFDNCTTRVRDYLNEALSGGIENYYDGLTAETFRDQVRAHYQSNAVVHLSLDVLMNSNVDRQVTEWEVMYLPLALREQLAAMPSDVAVDGERKMLLSDPQLVMSFAPPATESDPYLLASVVLLAPGLLLLLMLKRIPMSYFASHSQIGLKMEAFSFRLLGLLGLLTAVFSGVYGTLMLGSWFVSDHLDLHHNVNLLLFWPTDLLGIVVALRWLVMCKAWPTTHNSGPFINYYLLAHVISMLAYAVVAFAGQTEQAIQPIAVYILPGFFFFTVLVWVVGFQPARPKNMFF